MKLNELILKMLSSNSNVIIINRDVARILGFTEALALSGILQLWDTNKAVDNYFSCTVEELEELTTLTEHKQREAIKHLVETGIISVAKLGQPAKRHIKLN